MITLKHLHLTDLLPTWECEELQNARLKNTVLSATWEPRCRAFFLEEQDVSIANSIFSYLFLKQSPIKCGEEVGNPFLSPASIWEMKGLPRAWYVESIGTLITLAFTSDTVVLCQAKSIQKDSGCCLPWQLLRPIISMPFTKKLGIVHTLTSKAQTQIFSQV